MGSTRALAPLTGLLLAVAGCDTLPLACTLEARAAISVEIRDSATFAPRADGATVAVTEGAYSDTLILCGWLGLEGLTRCGAWERAGTYDVLVTRPGYQPWTRAAVRVTSDACHVRGVALTALLRPDP
jgi:hypothetical protein